MEKELLNKPVLAMYDVRGIQDYVFHTNKIKEIIGASHIVENIFDECLQEAVDHYIKEQNDIVILDWVGQKNNFSFESNGKILIERIFSGGGNHYILYRTGELCDKISKYISKCILRKTYSLNLAFAVVEKTESYKNDYKNLQQEMLRIKAKMPIVSLTRALPIIEQDLTTGYPIVDSKHKNAYISTESSLKMNAFKISEAEQSIENKEKNLDNLVWDKGNDSLLAIVHIDGNNMGKRIGDIMSQAETYNDAIPRQRRISNCINSSFDESFKGLKKIANKYINSTNKAKKYAMRKIILAGDDITFVCTARIAFELCNKYLSMVNEHYIYVDENNEFDEVNKLSACAGITFIHSHFPFATGYKIAEACCENAKKTAKLEKNLIGANKRVASWIDYQIINGTYSDDIDELRDAEYTDIDGKRIINRPFFVNENADNLSIENKCLYNSFKKDLELLNKLERSWVKEYRNIYIKGKTERELFKMKANSRDTSSSKKSDICNCSFDSLEALDIYVSMEGDNND